MKSIVTSLRAAALSISLEKKTKSVKLKGEKFRPYEKKESLR